MKAYRNIRLNPRLSAAASMVREGMIAADVGTDHAYLPVFLVRSGRCPQCIAGDIGEGPLENARETVKEYGVEHKVRLVLSDGLDCPEYRDAQDIVIAGMGGEMIVDILSRAPFLRNRRFRLILQPMTRAEEVHRFLSENGFRLVQEQAVTDAGRVYLVLCAEYAGQPYPLSGAPLYIGALNALDGPDAVLFIEKQRRRFQKELDGIRPFPDKAERVRELMDILCGLDYALKGEPR